MSGKGENEFKFAVIGFPQAGKSTYAAALYHVCSDCNKTDYRVVQGEEYLKKLDANLVASKEMPGTQDNKKETVKFACSRGMFSFEDYPGEWVAYKKTGELTPSFCTSIIGDSVGALILINPKEVEKRMADKDVEFCVSRYDPIIKYLSESKWLRSVAVVRTATDYYLSKDANLRQFEDFKNKLEERLSAANERTQHKFKLGFYDISCKDEKLDANKLFLPFQELIYTLERDEDEPDNDSCNAGEPPLPEKNNIKRSALLGILSAVTVILLIGGGVWVWRKCHPQSLHQPSRCEKCNLVADVKDGLCDRCRQMVEKRNADLEEYKKVLGGGDSIECIRGLNDLSDEYSGEKGDFASVSEECSRIVTKKYREILAEMKKHGSELKDQVQAYKKMVGSISWNCGALDNAFSDFSALSSVLGNTRNDTLKQNGWYEFVINAIRCKQLCTCAGSFEQEYEITAISIKVDNNPYRSLTLRPSFFQYSSRDHVYTLREMANRIEVLNCKSNCDWKNVWRGTARCKGNPWRCCGVKLRFEGDNRGPFTGSGSTDVVEIFNDNETIESSVKPFAPYKEKGPVKLSYRITCRMLKPDVKSPFAVEGGMK